MRIPKLGKTINPRGMVVSVMQGLIIGLATNFFLTVEKSVGSLLLKPFLASMSVAPTVGWLAVGFLGLSLISDIAMRVRFNGRGETLGSKLKMLTFVGGLLAVHGVYFGLLEAGHASYYAAHVAGMLCGAMVVSYELFQWAMTPEPKPPADLGSLLTPEQLEAARNELARRANVVRQEYDHNPTGPKPAANDTPESSRDNPASSSNSYETSLPVSFNPDLDRQVLATLDGSKKSDDSQSEQHQKSPRNKR